MSEPTKYRITVAPHQEPNKGEWFWTAATVEAGPVSPGQPISDSGSVERPTIFAAGTADQREYAYEQANAAVVRFHENPAAVEFITLEPADA